MLELQNISFGVSESQGKKEILKDISLTVGENKFVVITGPNGGGKSTLARMLCGLQKNGSGTVFWAGKPMSQRLRWKKAYRYLQRMGICMYARRLRTGIIM